MRWTTKCSESSTFRRPLNEVYDAERDINETRTNGQETLVYKDLLASSDDKAGHDLVDEDHGSEASGDGGASVGSGEDSGSSYDFRQGVNSSRQTFPGQG